MITAVLELFYTKTKISLRQILGGLGIVIGVYFLVPEFSLENTTTQGVFFGVLSAFVYTLRNIITKKNLSKIPAMTTLNYQLLFAFLTLSVPLLISTTNFSLPLAFLLLSEVPNVSFYVGSVIIMAIAIYELLPHKK